MKKYKKILKKYAKRFIAKFLKNEELKMMKQT